MFRIFLDGVCVHDDQTADSCYRVLKPHWQQEDNAAGSLTFSLTPESAAYDDISELKTDVVLKRNNKDLWYGRITSIETDFYKNKSVYCEGVYSYLNDVNVPESTSYTGVGNTDNDKALDCIKHCIEYVLGKYNDWVGATAPNRKIFLGTFDIDVDNIGYYLPEGDDVVTAKHTITRDINYDNCMSFISGIVDEVQCHVRVKKAQGGFFIDLLKDSSAIKDSAQRVEYGKNLIDLTTKIDVADIITAILPKGGQVKDSSDKDVDVVLSGDIEWPAGSGKKPYRYMQDDDAVSKYGFISEVVDFSYTKNKTQLVEFGAKYLKKRVENIVQYEVRAIDMFYLDQSEDPIDLGDRLTLYSRPHGIAGLQLTVVQIDIDLTSPASCTFTLGTKSKALITSAS